MKSPLIFDIKRSSTVDGPGIRTVIFLKGCNLDCYWCHNPEGKHPYSELAVFEQKCIGCDVCQKTCKNESDKCEACGECTETCPTGARKLYGKEYSISGLMDMILSDKLYYDATGGGVTFSGGECMLYPEFLAALARECKCNGISVAIDTAGCVPYSSFESVLPYADTFLYDVKCITTELHKKGTGRDNRLILDNLERLIKEEKRIIIRVPVIPAFNDGDELLRIKSFCEERGLCYELLPYHEFGKDKGIALKKKPKTNE